MAAKKKETEIAKAQKLLEELLGLMEVDGKVESSFDKENEAIILNISSENEAGKARKSVISCREGHVTEKPAWTENDTQTENLCWVGASASSPEM